MAKFTAIQLLLSRREYDALQEAITDSITDDPRFKHLSPVAKPTRPLTREPRWTSAFRAATRVYLGTNYGLQGIQLLLAQLAARKSRGATPPRKPLIASRQRFALSLATLLFCHRVLYHTLHSMRKELLQEHVQPFRDRHPYLWKALTWRLAPAAGASLSGLALGIYPQDQLRVTIALYVLIRAGELLYKGAEAKGYLKRKPKWVGSWMLAALSHGQLLHAFLFDPECVPAIYSDFILNNSPEYLQPRPSNLSKKVSWPTGRQQVDSLAQMADRKWPTYVSPILRPKDPVTLPAGISPAISPITDRAHPALQYLSCALIHPHETSCFPPFLRQILLSSSSIGRTMTLYYSALSLSRISSLVKQPSAFTTALVTQILRSTASIVATIAGIWGSICFGNNYLPKSFMSTFRFFVAGSIAGSAAAIDWSPTGHANNMYVLRNSLDSLWKVGVKRRWWRDVKGGDVYLVVLSLAVMNMLYDSQKQTFEHDGSMRAIKVLRGEIEVGLKNKTEHET